jgi:glyoxylate reductase
MSDPLPFVIITHALPAEWLTSLEGHCTWLSGPPAGAQPGGGLVPELVERLPQADGLISLLTIPVNEALLSQAPRLRVVSNMAVGVDNVDLEACTRRGIPVGNTPGVLTEATADLSMALILAAARRLPEAASDAKAGRWSTWDPTGWLGIDLCKSALGIAGMGKIGQAVAARAHGFGLRLIYNDIFPLPEIEERLGAAYISFDDLLSQSDILSLHLPLTEETRGLLNTQAFQRMKPSAILVNAARGPIVETAALQQALQQGWIRGAALDVTDPEPLPPDHPLYALPNCLIVPHIGSATHQTRCRMAELACLNLLAGLSGQRLPYCANPQVYRQA